jgi:hypothetical protein
MLDCYNVVLFGSIANLRMVFSCLFLSINVEKAGIETLW